MLTIFDYGTNQGRPSWVVMSSKIFIQITTPDDRIHGEWRLTYLTDTNKRLVFTLLLVPAQKDEHRAVARVVARTWMPRREGENFTELIPRYQIIKNEYLS